MHDLYKSLTDDPRLHFLTSELRRTRHQEYEIRVMIAKTDLDTIGDLLAFAKEHGLQGRIDDTGAWVELLEPMQPLRSGKCEASTRVRERTLLPDVAALVHARDEQTRHP